MAFLCLIVTFCISAQDKNGYLIDRNNHRTEVLFKDADFTDYTAIKYKISENDAYQAIDINNTIEYGIGDNFKFVRRTVKHDKLFTETATVKEPTLEKETLFLSVIEEGAINLYAYFDKGRMKFFYEIKDSGDNAIQFIYRRYSADNHNLKENNYFRNQLNDILKCETLQVGDFLNLKYKKEDFLKIFEKYNECKKQDSRVYENKSNKKLKLKYSILAGVYQSNFAVKFSGGKSEKETKTTLGFGGEVAMVLPSEKTEIFFRLEYENYSGKSRYSNNLTGTSRQENNFLLESSFIDINVGARYNFILNNKNKIFIEGAIGVITPFDDVVYSINFPEATGGAGNIVLKRTYSTKTTAYFNFGVGYTFNDKISVILRTDTNKDLFAEDTTNFSRTGLGLKYIFN